MIDALFVWLCTYLMHSTLLLGIAALLDRAGALRRPRLAEIVWRVALFGGVLTASMHAPLHMLWERNMPEQAVKASHAAGAAPLVQAPRAAKPAGPVLAPAASRAVTEETDAAWQLPTSLAPVVPLVVGAWLAWVAFGWTGIVLTAKRLNRMARACPPLDDAELFRFASGVAQRHGRMVPAIRLSAHWVSPLVTPNGEICVPHWALSQLDSKQRQAMLAHEIAHVMRGDPAWRYAAQLIQCLGFFQPLNAHALRRLDLAAELACDEWAASAAGNRRALAQVLYACAERLPQHATPPMVMAMARNPSPLLLRIGSLLKDVPMSSNTPFRTKAVLVSLAMVGAVLALPPLAVGGNAATKVVLNEPAGELSATIRGAFQLNADESDVAMVGESVLVRQNISGKTLSAEFVPGAAGKVARTYQVNGKTQALDAEGRAWLQKVLPTIMRQVETDATVAQRVKQLHAKGGTSLVLEEIRKIQSADSRERYLGALLSAAPPRAEQVGPILAVVGSLNEEALQAEAIVKLLKSAKFGSAEYGQVLATIGGMKTQNRTCDLLVALGAVMPADAELARQFRRAAKVLPDVERGRAERAIDHLNV
ncbi:M56 family metallopeptidase [Duganella sp. Root1480D1]|uniref:M56 family metallopeptidase n=1 Tax=Duganella sp. Root1480D1 TaxID=1736471 RepID=UPI00070C4AD4|nr:M56 family metallopeptidase [Duganella sp. Root1480D1]KQZ38718.1 hypothetical protein ASD58_28090 [Duganella sp. Root1480D1]